ncbi:uncharacterized protein LOC127280693 [Leptopilina boulardi]|uniref:uncharacterized protein LOC127280693 n=1 Tax=Leptopilina boulardi TaxID=63433 RepID=UPI0021F66B44|nr:uncharacterized protein LOC127280693 [Leptopilina boulardi]
MALKRLQSLERKLDKNLKFASLYYQEMDRFIKCGYAEKLDDVPKNNVSWYIPHFGVPNKTETKVRIIFDAAARYEGYSLNDFLMAGPTLLKNLIGVLMRFRQHPVAVKGDIRDMFLRVKLRLEDRDAQRFLWRKNDRSREPDEYVMSSLIFGSKASPTSALYVKNKNAEEFKSSMPEAVWAILNSSYVDDFLDSYETPDAAITTVKDIEDINSKGGFEMHTWISNNKQVAIEVNKADKHFGVEVNLGQNALLDKNLEKVLGLRWDTEKDVFRFNVNLSGISENIKDHNEIPTKRIFLKIIMSIYDPLGLIAPLLIQSKIIMQDVWANKIEWDEKIGQAEFEKWKKWFRELREVSLCDIPRCYVSQSKREIKRDLHIFCDASTKAYACVGYWRTEFEDGSVETSIIASKSRVAPLKPLSIPRLELQATLLGTRLAKTISDEHTVPIYQRVFWSDSQTVLAWIKSSPRDFHTFVAHRLGEIAESTNPLEWKWVPTDMNPADYATRFTGIPIHTNKAWFNGPSFLTLNEDAWPIQKSLKLSQAPEVESEKRKIVSVLKVSEKACLPDYNKFCSWKRLLGSTARLITGIQIWTKKYKSEETAEYYIRAENLLLKQAQKESFSEEIVTLQRKGTIKVTSKISALTPELDDNGLMIVNGRIDSIVGTNVNCHPIILDGKHPITRLLLEYYHIEMKHGNIQTVINEIRQKFWVTGLRNVLKSIRTKCKLCKLRREKPKTPRMGMLPEVRTAYHERPFTNCGLDYFGPLYVTVGRRREKRWGALFTCLSTRGIHLEIVHSLSADSAIMALRRMMSRRGQPSVIFTDNGTNFVGASREIKTAFTEMEKNQQLQFAAENKIKWVFTPPIAPHMGGAWERLVRSVKVSLRAILTEQAPKEELLSTLFAEVEHCINSRPLTHVSLDPQEKEALTPNHFLIGSSSGKAICARFRGVTECTKSQWLKAQRLADQFWERWLKEYVPTMIARQKWTEETDPLEVGDVVLVAHPQETRSSWPRGIIEAVYPGPDGRIRVVMVKTARGKFRRPTTGLIRISKKDEVQGS